MTCLSLETTALAGELPPLPPFKSEEIRAQVFTHRSYHGRPNHVFEDHPEDPSPDNERLEHLGDTVLSLVVTAMMIEMFPTLHVGPSTKIRALVIGNATLADIAVRYKLPADLKLHPAQAITLRMSPNVQADLFESYVGGLYQDQGLEVVQAWLTKLMHPYARAAYRLIRNQHGLSLATPTPPSSPTEGRRSRSPFCYVNSERITTTIGHLSLFNQHVQKTNRSVEWVYNPTNPELDPAAQGSEQLIGPGMMRGMKATPIWSVKVIVDGECLGQGKGGTKKSARNEAAKHGLESLGIHVYPDLYFKPPIGFRLLSTQNAATKMEKNADGGKGNSRHDFSRLRPGAMIFGGLLLGAGLLKRMAACLNVKRLWMKDDRRQIIFKNNSYL